MRYASPSGTSPPGKPQGAEKRWNIAFKRLGVVVTNNYLYASPFVTVVVGWLLLGEKISWMSILGAVLITLGVIFANKDGSQS